MKCKILIIILAAIMLSTACSSKKEVQQEPPRQETVRLTADPATLLQDLQSRNRSIISLRSSEAEFEYRLTKTTEGYEGTGIRFAVKKPGNVYVRASATGVGDIFYLHSNGKNYWVEATREEKLYTGSLGNLGKLSVVESDELWRNLTPEVLSEAFLIDNLDDFTHSSFAIEPDFYIIFLFDEGVSSDLLLRRQIWISRENLKVVRHRVYNQFGDLTTEAHLYKYDEVDSIDIPHYIRIERYWESISIRLSLREIILNSDLPDGLFEYESAPQGFEVIDLDKRDTDAKSGKS